MKTYEERIKEAEEICDKDKNAIILVPLEENIEDGDFNATVVMGAQTSFEINTLAEEKGMSASDFLVEIIEKAARDAIENDTKTSDA